ncbi:MAG: AAA family ATPase, partial [Dehalococcoidia bacterium]|nr:AAA family ATPase [Dehalococcoidia bacterium]
MRAVEANDLFVGRTDELQALDAAWRRAVGGEGGIVAISGEPGIGKTRLADEMSARAVESGGRVLSGRAQELAGAPPYWPWIELIRSLLSAATADEVGAWLSGEGAEVARLVPELAGRLETALAEPSGDADQARWLLLQGVSTFLWSAADDGPALVILDDLHWANASSTLLLQHFARGLDDRAVLLLVLYRAEPVVGDHPLLSTLGELGRSRRFERIELSGLSRSEMASFLESRSSTRPASSLVDAVSSRSDGNPLFLRELAAATERAGDATGLMEALPQGVREAAESRLRLVSSAARDVLGWAALLGEEFAVAELATARGRARDEVLAALNDAFGAGLVVEDPQRLRYRFTHALIRDALVEELSALGRSELHAQIAARFEAAGDDGAAQSVGRIAYHYSEAAELEPQLNSKAAEYAVLAAESAGRVSAWREAAQQYERALELLRRDPADSLEREGRLLIRLAEAEYAAGNAADGERHYRAAVGAHRGSGGGVELASSILKWVSRSFQYPAPGERRRLVTEALEAVGDEDDVLRARLLAELLNGTDESAKPEQAAEVRALAELHQLGDVEARLAIWDAQRHYAARRWDEYRDRLYEAALKFRQAGDRRGLSMRSLADSIPILVGTFDEATALDARVVGAAEQFGNAGYAALLRGRLAIVEIHRGNRERARELLDGATLSRREHVMLAVPNAWLAELDGDLALANTILEEIPPEVAYPRSWLSAVRARLAQLVGDEAAAHEHLVHWEREFEEIRHQTPGFVCMGLLESAVTLPNRERREEMLEQSASWDGLHYGNYGTFDRVRGLLA